MPRCISQITIAHVIVWLVALITFTVCHAAPSLDTSFGDNGLVRIAVPSGFNDFAYASAQQTDGKILVTGTSEGRETYAFVTRFSSDGTLDVSFGTTGTLLLAPPTGSYWLEPVQIEPQADGSVILLATVYDGFVLARITASGTLDASFGNAGLVLINDIASVRFSVQPDGNIMVVTDATQGASFALHVRRFLPNGAVDMSFGTSGDSMLTALPPDFTFQSTNLAHGTSDGGMTLAALPTIQGGTYLLLHITANGTLETSFGNGGYISGYGLGNPRDLPTQIARTPTGYTVLIGDATDSSGQTTGQIFLWEVGAKGTLNSAFGSGGRQQVSTMSQYPYGRLFKLGILPDGGMATSETGNGDSDNLIYLSRFDANGAPVTSFGSSGKATATAAGYMFVSPVGLYADSSGGITVASWAAANVSQYGAMQRAYAWVDAILFGVSSAGQPRAGFGNTSGLGIWNNPAYSSDTIDAIRVDPSGRILLAGFSDGSGMYDFLVSRLQPDGALDTSYANNGRLSPQQFAHFTGVARAALQPNGALVVAAGTAQGSYGTVATVTDFRVDPNGVLDGTFNPGLASPAAANDTVALGVRPDGRVVYGATPYTGNAVLQQTLADGTADPSFGTAGTVSFPLGERSRQADLAVLADGSIVFAVLTDQGIKVFKVDASGSPVASFGTGGKFIYTGDFPNSYDFNSDLSLLMLADGSFLATVGMFSLESSSQWLLAVRISGNGKLTRASTLLGGNTCLYWLLAAMPDGSVLIARSRSAALYRMMPDDSFDPSFGSDGAYTLAGFSSVSALALDADGKLLVAGQGSTSALVGRYALNAATPTVVEFYNTNLDNYFITADSNEAAAIDGGSAGAGWSRTGNTFKSGGSTSVCRFYGSQSPGPNSHFYTANAGECDHLKQLQASTPATEKRWNFESLDFMTTLPTDPGELFYKCPTDTTPVYRAYNNGWMRGLDSNHRITSSVAAIQEVMNRGWNYEGEVMCAPLDSNVAPASNGNLTQGGLTWFPNDKVLRNWVEANDYCAGTGGRLPTNDEWIALNASGATYNQAWTLSYTWSSTPQAAGAHYIMLYGGFGWSDDGWDFYVTCVR